MIATAHPSCGYAPLQRLATNRCTALLVRRSRPRINDSNETAQSGIPSDPPVTPPRRSNSSHVVAPTTGFNPPWPADRANSGSEEHKPARPATLMEFLPLRRLSPSESTPRRIATPATFRPQGFSPSRRITPRSDARPCFMPETPMGFRSPGGYPHCQVPWLVTRELPSWRFSDHCGVNSATNGTRSPQTPSRELTSRVFAAFRALLRQWIRTAAGLLHPRQTADPLLSFLRLSRVLPNAYRPRRALRVPLLRLALSPSSSQPRDKPETNLRRARCVPADSPENAGFHSEK
jgi:hypothetical protein